MQKTILIAEDSQDDEVLCRMVLQKVVANRLVVVRNGKEVIDYLTGVGDFRRRDKYPMPDVLMLDLKMPKVDGFGVLEWLKTYSTSKLFVVVLTNFGQTKDVIRAYALGAHSFLTKPLKYEDVVNLTTHFQGYWDLRPAALPFQRREFAS